MPALRPGTAGWCGVQTQAQVSSLRSSLGVKKILAIAILASSGEHSSESPPPHDPGYLGGCPMARGFLPLSRLPLPCQASSSPLGLFTPQPPVNMPGALAFTSHEGGGCIAEQAS